MFSLTRVVGRSPASILHRRLLTHPSPPSPSQYNPLRLSFSKSPPPKIPASLRAQELYSTSSSPNSTTLSIGLISGTLGSLAGLGGSLISIPLLTRYSVLTAPTIAGTSLLAVLGTTSAATATHLSSSNFIPLTPALIVGTTAAIAAPLGAFFAPSLPTNILRKILGVTLLAISPLPVIRPQLKSSLQIDDPKPLWISGGLVAGFFSGLLGISGGAMITPLLTITLPDLDFSAIIGTTFATLIPSAAAGAVVYLWRGLVDLSRVPLLLVGGAVGGILGSKIIVEAPAELVRWGLSLMFAAMGWRIFRRPLRTLKSTNIIERKPLKSEKQNV